MAMKEQIEGLKKPRISKSEILLQRLRNELGISLPFDAMIVRTRSGRNQKAMGAWSWLIHSKSKPVMSIGSPVTVTELISSKKLHAVRGYGKTDIEIFN